MEKPYGRLSPDRRVLGLVNNNNNIYSPTDNLHLLTNVASELADSADRARKLRLQSKSSSRRNSDFKPRKDKSLGILCDKFLAMFPLSLEDDCPSIEICLDKVANQLGIVKRRIYDIINILESLHMTSRVAKNRYEWHGNRNLKPVLSHLRRLAYQYGLDAKMQEVQVQQKLQQSKSTTSSALFSCACSDSSQTSSSSLPFDSENFFHDERTLGIMCQKFIMLFLVTDEGSAINLDVATQMLVNAVEKSSVTQQPHSDGSAHVCGCLPRHKTKVRRLYDIANVLTSLGLIRKERYNLSPVRKPVFVYNGPILEDHTNEMPEFCGSHTMRNSLLMVPVNEAKELSSQSRTTRLNRKRKDESVHGPAEKIFCTSSEDSNDAKPVTRLGSLEDILRVAEQEFKLLMSGESSEETSMSFSCADSTRLEELDLSQLKEEHQVKEEPLSDDENVYSGNSSSFESYDSAFTNFSVEIEPKLDQTPFKTEFPEETTLANIETVFPAVETTHPSVENQSASITDTDSPVTETALRIAGTTVSIAETIVPIAETVGPIGETNLRSVETILPVVETVSQAETVLPIGPTVLPIAKFNVTEAPITELKTVDMSSDKMVNIKVVSGHSGDVTHAIQKIPSFSCGQVTSMQSGNDQLAIGKLKRFTVTRKLIPSHFVLQKGPSNNLKLTLHHAPGVKGLIRLKPVSSSPKLCLPVTCIKTLKRINVVKAAPAAAGIPRTVEMKKRVHLVPMNTANPKGNISVVQ